MRCLDELNKTELNKFRGKVVLLRCDLNVPLRIPARRVPIPNGALNNNSPNDWPESAADQSTAQRIGDGYKIQRSISTIKFLLRQQCRVIIITHLGDPNGFEWGLSTRILLPPLSKLLKQRVVFLGLPELAECLSESSKTKTSGEKVLLLENIRFDPRERSKDKKSQRGLAQELSKLADIYVNDAFGVCHRPHATMVMLPKLLPSYGGLLLKEEVNGLSAARQRQRKSLWIIGGAKGDKMRLVKRALVCSDRVLIAGSLCLNFILPPNRMSKKAVLELRHHRGFSKIVLPIDFRGVDNRTGRMRVVSSSRLTNSYSAYDIGPKSVSLFKKYLRDAAIIVWNGPLGRYEKKPFDRGTSEVMGAINREQRAICGGGETADAVKKLDLAKKFSHISTGGGASLSFLSGEKLPGLEALRRTIPLK